MCSFAARAGASAPSIYPLTTTATFPNAGQQIRSATPRINTSLRPKKNKLVFKLPFTPAGVKGRGEAGDKQAQGTIPP